MKRKLKFAEQIAVDPDDFFWKMAAVVELVAHCPSPGNSIIYLKYLTVL